MATKSFVDGRAQGPDLRQCLIIEAKTHAVHRKSSRHWGRGVQGLVAAGLIAFAILVPRFLLTFALLIVCIILSLVAFILVVQLPVRFLASRFRDPAQSSSRPIVKPLRNFGQSRRD